MARGAGGGPKTAAGKQASSRNATTHGLTSRVLPAILQSSGVDAIYADFAEEWLPATPTERLLLREAARHAAVLEKIESMEPAVLRRGAWASLSLVPHIDSDPSDVALAGASTSDAIAKLTRYRRTHERAVHRSLDALREFRDRSNHRSNRTLPPFPFLDEAGCQEHLRKFQSGRYHCRKCGEHAPRVLVNSKSLQCRACRTQSGLRAQTIFAGSQLPLRPWFQAVYQILQNPSLEVQELARVMKVDRMPTVRSVRHKIIAALASQNSSALIAGLDLKFSPDGRC